MDQVELICRIICEHEDEDPDDLEPGSVPFGNDDRERFTDGEINGMSAFFVWRTHTPLARAILAAIAKE